MLAWMIENVEGVDLDNVTAYGDTLLHKFVSYNQKDLLVAAIKKGANINIKNAANQTPLEVANAGLLDEIA